MTNMIDNGIEPMGYSYVQIIQYLKRIKYINKDSSEEIALPAPNLSLLNNLMTLHLHSIPYGNTSYIYYQKLNAKDPNQYEPTHPNYPNITKGVSLHPIDIFKKLVIKERDGYCFENNLLFFNVLYSLGYSVYLVGARVVDQAIFSKDGEEVFTGLRHCAMIVHLNKVQYLVDVGFNFIPNFQAIPIPQDIKNEVESAKILLPDNTYLQIVKRYPKGAEYLEELVKPTFLVQCIQPKCKLNEKLVGTQEGSELIDHPLFYITMEAFFPQDIKLLNYYIAMDESIVFNQHLIIRRMANEPHNCLLRLFDNQLKFIYNDGKVVRKILKDEKDRRQILKHYFDVNVDEEEEFLPREFVDFTDKQLN